MWTADSLAAEALARLPALASLLEQRGDMPLQEHVRSLGQALPSPLQDRGDFLDILAQAADHLAPGLGAAAAETVAARPVVLTGNHHGLDTLAQSWQSTLAFALPELLAGRRTPVVVLATGLPSMNNSTFPAGLLCTDFATPAGGGDGWRTVRLPLSPVRLRQTMVSAAPAATLEELHRARRAAIADPRLHPLQRRTLLPLLDACAHGPATAPATRFVEQAGPWNARLWRQAFAGDLAPPLAFLELEAVTSRLLALDLRQPASLLHALFWDEALRNRVLAALDGCPGCWTLARLEAMARLDALGLERPGHADVAGAGTCFFWATDEKGRQTPLWLRNSTEGWRLEGICRSGRHLAWPWAAEAVLGALARRELLPSLFSSYATLALARGIACVGGVYQTGYLARMLAGTSRALREHGKTGLSDRLAAISGDWFLAGVHLLFLRRGQTCAPAHLPDVLTGGPLTANELQRMGRLRLGQAIMAGLVQTCGEVLPATARPAGWRDALSHQAVTNWAPDAGLREVNWPDDV